MPVEDIDFLYKNSVKESIIILVDSSKRNKLIYPKPAEFQIDFHEPFTFVYGIDILDTTIPRTAFMIDIYNNQLVFKEASNLNQNGVEFQRVTFTLQDFPSAEVFYQRLNEQLEYYTETLQIDNYENLFDNSIYEQRAKSDYPIIRFVNAKPFFLDMRASTTKTIFGFDQYPDRTDFSKYLTSGEILNSYVGVNNIDYTYDSIPHASSALISYDTREEAVGSSSLQTVRFNYIHSSEYSIGTYLQSITLFSNKTFTNNNDYYITITIRNVSKNVTLLDEYQNIFFNSFVTSDSEGLTVTFEDFLLLNSKTQLLLTNGDQYQITVRNVYVEPMYTAAGTEEVPLSIQVRMNYVYFANLHNLALDNDKVFYAKPIYNTTDGRLVLNLTNDLLNTKRLLLRFDTIQNQILIALSVYGIGTIRRISLGVPANSNLSPTDVFVLRMTKKIVGDNENHHVCEFVMTLHIDEANNYTLVFENDRIDHNVLGHVNLDISSDDTNPNYFLNVSYEFDLFSSKTVVLDTAAEASHTVEYQFFKEFSLIAPGMLNLASENYIVLRCDEIENHLRGSHDVKDFSPGLGVLNIDVQGYASGRTEFFSVKYKEFHPIGKLSKMKFRFERKSDGKLYDFRNIDLHFLMSIKYLKPVQKQNFEQSVLNPNYNPNYLGYFNKTLHDLYDEESSDDDSDIDEAYFESTFNDRENELAYKMRRSDRF